MNKIVSHHTVIKSYKKRWYVTYYLNIYQLKKHLMSEFKIVILYFILCIGIYNNFKTLFVDINLLNDRFRTLVSNYTVHTNNYTPYFLQFITKMLCYYLALRRFYIKFYLYQKRHLKVVSNRKATNGCPVEVRLVLVDEKWLNYELGCFSQNYLPLVRVLVIASCLSNRSLQLFILCYTPSRGELCSLCMLL